MKMKYVIGLVLIVLMVSCAKQAATPTPAPTAPAPAATPPAPVPAAPAPAETTPAETTPAPAAGGDVILTRTGFNPDTLNIKAGSTVVFMNDDKSYHVIYQQMGGTIRSPRLAKGEKFDYTFEKAGTYSLMDDVSKKKITITVE